MEKLGTDPNFLMCGLTPFHINHGPDMQNIFCVEEMLMFGSFTLSKEQSTEIGRVLVQPSFEEGFAINFEHVLTNINCKQLHNYNYNKI